VCMIGLKIKNGTALCLDEIHTHWKRLRFEYEVDPKLQKADILRVLFFYLKLCYCPEFLF